MTGYYYATLPSDGCLSRLLVHAGAYSRESYRHPSTIQIGIPMQPAVYMYVEERAPSPFFCWGFGTSNWLKMGNGGTVLT